MTFPAPVLRGPGSIWGPSLSTRNSRLILRVIDTPIARMRMALATAGELARWLVAHPSAKRVVWPGRSIRMHNGTDEIQHGTFRMEGAALSRWRDWAGAGVFRPSVGLEDPFDPIADLARALDP